MCLPDCHGSLDGQIPEDHPAVGIAGQEAQILAEEVYGMNLGGMATEDI